MKRNVIIILVFLFLGTWAVYGQDKNNEVLDWLKPYSPSRLEWLLLLLQQDAMNLNFTFREAVHVYDISYEFKGDKVEVLILGSPDITVNESEGIEKIARGNIARILNRYDWCKGIKVECKTETVKLGNTISERKE